jgi:hypothetical protein
MTSRPASSRNSLSGREYIEEVSTRRADKPGSLMLERLVRGAVNLLCAISLSV